MTSARTWTFEDWRQLAKDDPAAAARDLHRKARTLFTAAQQRAVLAWMPDEATLTSAFAAAPPSSPLGGVPYFLKDLFDLKGIPTFAGSTFLPEVRPTPTRDSTLVQALKRTGAVCAGKTQLNEFAYGITGENSHYGDCEHPHFPGRLTGGSSSGSAAAVAAGVVPLAFGSDTGGSIRVPAAFCGLYGFRMKPEHPWIEDAFPLAPGCDTVGWFTSNPADLLATNAALVGLGASQRTLNGCYLDYGELEADVALACREAASRLCAAADETLRGELIHGFAPARDTYNFIVTTQAWEVHQGWAERFRERYDPAVWARLNRVHTLTKPQLDSALTGLSAVRAVMKSFFQTYDFLVLPATPCAALTKADCTLASRNRLLTLTSPASLAGLPVLTVPVALPSGLTTGLQIIMNDVQSPVVSWALKQL